MMKDERVGSAEEGTLEVLRRMPRFEIFLFIWMASLLNSVVE
jgi:hypothetical protein